jgi:hypothetical protein
MALTDNFGIDARAASTAAACDDTAAAVAGGRSPSGFGAHPRRQAQTPRGY